MLLPLAGLAICTGVACSGIPGSDSLPDSAASPPAESEPDTTALDRSDTSASADTFFEGSEQVWLEAGARGVTFRAVGQEPGWLVEFGPNDRLRILMDYGAQEIELALPEPVIDSTTWVTTYRVRTEDHTVRIDIRDEPCADVMSGERFSATVLLLLDGVRYDGCGRTLPLP